MSQDATVGYNGHVSIALERSWKRREQLGERWPLFHGTVLEVGQEYEESVLSSVDALILSLESCKVGLVGLVGENKSQFAEVERNDKRVPLVVSKARFLRF